MVEVCRGLRWPFATEGAALVSHPWSGVLSTLKNGSFETLHFGGSNFLEAILGQYDRDGKGRECS